MLIEIVGAIIFLILGKLSIDTFFIAIRLLQCPQYFWERIQQTQNPDAKEELIRRMLRREYDA